MTSSIATDRPRRQARRRDRAIPATSPNIRYSVSRIHNKRFYKNSPQACQSQLEELFNFARFIYEINHTKWQVPIGAFLYNKVSRAYYKRAILIHSHTYFILEFGLCLEICEENPCILSSVLQFIEQNNIRAYRPVRPATRRWLIERWRKSTLLSKGLLCAFHENTFEH